MLALKAELAEKLLEKDPVLAKQQLKDIAAASRQNLDLVREIVADRNTLQYYKLWIYNNLIWINLV